MTKAGVRQFLVSLGSLFSLPECHDKRFIRIQILTLFAKLTYSFILSSISENTENIFVNLI